MTVMRIVDDNRPLREPDGKVGQYSFWLGDEGDPGADDDTEATEPTFGQDREDER